VSDMPPMSPRVRAALVAVLQKHGVTYAELVHRTSGGSRARGGNRPTDSKARIRWEAMAALSEILREDGRRLLSNERIGKMLDGMDHTSVRHGLRRWAEINQPSQSETDNGDLE
jgi:hypothetical protein